MQICIGPNISESLPRVKKHGALSRFEMFLTKKRVVGEIVGYKPHGRNGERLMFKTNPFDVGLFTSYHGNIGVIIIPQIRGFFVEEMSGFAEYL